MVSRPGLEPFIRHTGGSPSCAIFAMQKTASFNISSYPEAASLVNEKFYLDDYLDPYEDVTRAIMISRDSVSLI